MPVASIIMSVYNDERYLDAAVESILGQTFRDFEFIIIDDGSTDRCPEMLEQYAARDDRIRLVHQENMGLQKSLNKAAGLAEGLYVARMDADDISMPERLERQVAFLERHANVSLVATTMKEIDDAGTVTGLVWNEDVMTILPEHIYHTLAYENCIVHSSVMLRRNVLLDEPYDESFRFVEDYDLWTRLAGSHVLAKIDEPLMLWRRHGKSMTVVSYEMTDTTYDIAHRIKRKRLSQLNGRPLTAEQIEGISGRIKPIPAAKLPGLLLLRLKIDLLLFLRRPKHLDAIRLLFYILRKDLRFARRIVQEGSRRMRSRTRDLWGRLFSRSRG